MPMTAGFSFNYLGLIVTAGLCFFKFSRPDYDSRLVFQIFSLVMIAGFSCFSQFSKE